jgi:hypothetical protein
MLIREVAESSPSAGPYYHDTLAAQLPAGLTDDDDIVGKAFVIAGMKMGMVKASKLFRYTPGFEQEVVAAYHRLHNELKETVVDDDLATAQEIGAQLQSAMEDLYYAHRMGNPNPTVKQNIDMLQKSVRSFNQELNGMGYKYAPTVPGLVAKMGTRYVEEAMNIDEITESIDSRVAPVAPPLRTQPTKTQPKQTVYIAPEKKTPAAVIHIDKKEVKEGERTARIFHPQYVDVYFLDGPRREPILVNRKVPYNLIDRYLELAIKKYNLQQGRFEFRNAEEDLAEFALPGGDDREPDEEHILRQLAAQWWLGTEQQMARAQQTLAAMGWEIGQDESGDDDAGVFVVRAGDVNGDSYIAFPHSELSLDEGFRVTQPQIRGTQTRAQSAYYPTNTKPHVPKLDTPLTDRELARLSQLAGIKNK